MNNNVLYNYLENDLNRHPKPVPILEGRKEAVLVLRKICVEDAKYSPDNFKFGWDILKHVAEMLNSAKGRTIVGCAYMPDIVAPENPVRSLGSIRLLLEPEKKESK